MRILLTVVVGYIDFTTTMLHSRVFTEIFIHNGENKDIDKPLEVRLGARIEEIRKSWPKELSGLQNVISVSHSIFYS